MRKSGGSCTVIDPTHQDGPACLAHRCRPQRPRGQQVAGVDSSLASCPTKPEAGLRTAVRQARGKGLKPSRSRLMLEVESGLRSRARGHEVKPPIGGINPGGPSDERLLILLQHRAADAAPVRAVGGGIGPEHAGSTGHRARPKPQREAQHRHDRRGWPGCSQFARCRFREYRGSLRCLPAGDRPRG